MQVSNFQTLIASITAIITLFVF